MAVVIRLRRIGKRPKKRPHFRITVFDERKARDSKFIEEIGFYNHINASIKINQERFDYWVKNGAQISPTVKSLIKKYQKEAKNATSAAG